MKSVRDSLMGDGVLCPEHGVDYSIECEKCHEVTRDYVLKNSLYLLFMKIIQIPHEPKHEPWDSDAFLFYMRNEKAIHEEELEMARTEGDREGELRESGYLQALGFVIDALLNE